MENTEGLCTTGILGMERTGKARVRMYRGDTGKAELGQGEVGICYWIVHDCYASDGMTTLTILG